MEIPGWIPALLVSITHLLWTCGSWFFGHFIYLIVVGCTNETVKECHITNFASSDFLAIVTLLIGSTVYFRIAQHVINALYKGELPTKNATELIGNIFASSISNTGNRKQRRAVQKRR